jgi:hypothetical protein
MCVTGRPHQEALRCLISIGLLLFLNRKTEKPKNRIYIETGGVEWPLISHVSRSCFFVNSSRPCLLGYGYCGLMLRQRC